MRIRLPFIIVALLLSVICFADGGGASFCEDGTLLFREDFGGNMPAGPVVGREPLLSMSSNYHMTVTPNMPTLGPGVYMLAKVGWTNGGQWYTQDDHTYPDDIDRGYFLEVDGIGGGDIFYETEISGLCPKSTLSFSAYVANVYTSSQKRFQRDAINPRMKFVIENCNGVELATYGTDTIPFDWAQPDWHLSSRWHHVGMLFEVPDTTTILRLKIYNNTEMPNILIGNDFALDDIEIRLCVPPVTITSPHVAECGKPYTFSVDFQNDGTYTEPLRYKWFYCPDNIPWDAQHWREIGDVRDLQLPSVSHADAGFYRVAVASEVSIDCPNCRAMSEAFLLTETCPGGGEVCTDGTLLFREDFGGNDPEDVEIAQTPLVSMSSDYSHITIGSFLSMGAGSYMLTKRGYCNGDTSAVSKDPRSMWYIQDDHTHPDDYTRGYFLEVDGKGDGATFFETELTGLCANTTLSFSAYVANVYTSFQQAVGNDQPSKKAANPRLKFILTDTKTNRQLASYDTDTIPFDWSLLQKEDWRKSGQWHLVGDKFRVPDGVSSVKLSIVNNVLNSIGNDFAIDDIEVHLCAPPVTISGYHATECGAAYYFKSVDFENDGTFAVPLEYQWYFSQDSIHWQEIKIVAPVNLLSYSVTPAMEGWYRVAVAGRGNIDCPNCRVMSEPFHLTVNCLAADNEDEFCSEGRLLLREDFGGNNPGDPSISTQSVRGTRGFIMVTDATWQGTSALTAGTYMVTKSGYCNADTANGGIPTWYIQDDHTYPNDHTRGYFMEINNRSTLGNNYTTIYQSQDVDVCEGREISFSAYVANIYTAYQQTLNHAKPPRIALEIRNALTNRPLYRINTDNIPFDAVLNRESDWRQSSRWHHVGINYIVPKGITKLRFIISNATGGSSMDGEGNDLALDDIEVRLCVPSVTITSSSTATCGEDYMFSVDFQNDGTFSEPLAYKWFFSLDGSSWAQIDTNESLKLTAVTSSQAGWYRVVVADEANIDCYTCRSMSDPFYLSVSECPVPCPETVPTIHRDTTVCDTLFTPYYIWRNHTFLRGDTMRTDTLRNADDCDTLYVEYQCNITHCELPLPPCEPAVYQFDTIVCDTLLAAPFLWHGHLFTSEEVLLLYETDIYGCDSIVSLSLATIPCRRDTLPNPDPDPEPEPTDTLYNIIVNKYDYQLLCNNIRVRTLFPNVQRFAYQWYKNTSPVLGATMDDYAEEGRLEGSYQLYLTIDDTLTVHSNIITIAPIVPNHVCRCRVFSQQGLLLWEQSRHPDEQPLPPLPAGIYIVFVETDESVSSQKYCVQ